jgi:hypothetical protein
MTEIPLPTDYPEKKEHEEVEKPKGCCDRFCECWCQIVGAIILIAILLAFISAFFGPIP